MPPAAAEPDWSTELEVLPEALVDDEELGLVEPEDEVEPCGQEQFSAGPEVEPDALDWSVVEELALPDVPPLALDEGKLELLLDDGAVVLPEALVDPDALPEPDDWLVCAPWSIVEDGLVVVALWLALAPLEEFTLPEPTFTSGLMLAPAFTSVLLMPTFASTPTLGFTLVLLDEPLAALGCEALEPEDVWAKAGPNAPITAAAVILTAKFRSLMLAPFWK